MSRAPNPGRRALLAGAAIAAVPSAALAGDMAVAFTPEALDARLVTLAGNLRQAEADYSALVALDDAARSDKAELLVSFRIAALVGAMAAIPAAGLEGIAAKAGRLCWSLNAGTGGTIMRCDEPLAESLAADLARMSPQAVGAWHEPLSYRPLPRPRPGQPKPLPRLPEGRQWLRLRLQGGAAGG